MTSVQRKNTAMVGLLSDSFQPRYEPNFAVGNMMSTFLALPELRGLWAASVVNEAGALMDLAVQGRTLTNVASAPRGVSGLLPYVSYNGTTRYHSRADEAGLDITGSLTLGGWFYNTNIAAAYGLIGKDNTAANRSYACYSLATGQTQFSVCPLGTTASAVSVVSTNVISITVPYFVAGRFTSSSELAIFLNDTKTTNVVGVPAATFNGTAAFVIGALADPAFFLPGRFFIGFLCASAVPDAIITNLYEQTRAGFGG